MLNVEFTLNVLNLILLVTGSMILGYFLRSRQIQKKQSKIAELRKEIVYNHSQILELQIECVELEKSMKNTKATVLPMSVVKSEIKETAAL